MSGESPVQSEVVPPEPVIVECDLFDTRGADVVLKSVEEWEDANDVHHVLKVHKVKLSTVSSFFADMFASITPDTREQETVSDLPAVTMEKGPEIIEGLLSFAYNSIEVLPVLPYHRQIDFNLNLYEAAHKYGITSMRLFSSQSLQYAYFLEKPAPLDSDHLSSGQDTRIDEFT
jgi:hypothetical protein